MANDEDDSTSAPKRAPRKRAVRRVAPKKETVTRKTVSVPVSRKAPTVVTARTEKRSIPIKYFVLGGLALVVVGSAAWIGFSDNGQIDVNARIMETNNRTAKDASDAARESGDTSQGEFIPVQNTPPVIPASFMSPSDDQTAAFAGDTQIAPAVEEPVATSTATTTETVGESDVENTPEAVEGVTEVSTETPQ
jgi:hypothetical protein